MVMLGTPVVAAVKLAGWALPLLPAGKVDYPAVERLAREEAEAVVA